MGTIGISHCYYSNNIIDNLERNFPVPDPGLADLLEGDGVEDKTESLRRQNAGGGPLPRDIMPDRSEPRQEQILSEPEDPRGARIERAFCYIKYDQGGCALCKIIPGGGKICFHEIVEHTKYGISEDDIAESVKTDTGIFSLPGHYQISPVVGINSGHCSIQNNFI